MAKKTNRKQMLDSPKPAPKAPWVYALLAIFFFAIFYGQVVSGDLWWQLKTGQ